MATQAQLDQILALIRNGDFDQASAFFKEEWDDLWLTFAQYLLVQGAAPVHLEDLAISESWNLHLRAAEDFGASGTHLYGVPTVDQAVVSLPVTGLFVPPKGYRFLIANGSSTNRLTVDPDGAATIDGAAALDVEPLGTLELVFEGISGREFRVLDGSAERVARVPLVDADGAAGLLSWQNPFGSPILVDLVLDVTTPAIGVYSANFGQVPTAAASGNLIGNVDLGTAAGVFSSHEDQGGNGRTYRRLDAGDFVTGSTLAGAAAGLVGTAFINYRMA